jgi:hypothetical protein
MPKELQLLEGISRMLSSHMAERCLIPNQPNRSKMFRKTAENTHSVIQAKLSTFLQKIDGQLFWVFVFVFNFISNSHILSTDHVRNTLYRKLMLQQ